MKVLIKIVSYTDEILEYLKNNNYTYCFRVNPFTLNQELDVDEITADELFELFGNTIIAKYDERILNAD